MLKTLRIDEDTCCMLLPQLRKYVGSNASSQDSILLSCLNAAIIEVQDRSARSVAPCEMRLEASCISDTVVPLYGDVAQVTSVRTPAGQDVAFASRGNAVDTLGAIHEDLVIDYTTAPDEGEKQRLIPVVLQYAAALFDGQTDEIHKILAQC